MFLYFLPNLWYKGNLAREWSFYLPSFLYNCKPNFVQACELYTVRVHIKDNLCDTTNQKKDQTPLYPNLTKTNTALPHPEGYAPPENLEAKSFGIRKAASHGNSWMQSRGSIQSRTLLNWMEGALHISELKECDMTRDRFPTKQELLWISWSGQLIIRGAEAKAWTDVCRCGAYPA